MCRLTLGGGNVEGYGRAEGRRPRVALLFKQLRVAVGDRGGWRNRAEGSRLLGVWGGREIGGDSGGGNMKCARRSH